MKSFNRLISLKWARMLPNALEDLQWHTKASNEIESHFRVKKA